MFFNGGFCRVGNRTSKESEELETVWSTLYNGFASLVGSVSNVMYSYVLIILLLRFVQGSNRKREEELKEVH